MSGSVHSLPVAHMGAWGRISPPTLKAAQWGGETGCSPYWSLPAEQKPSQLFTVHDTGAGKRHLCWMDRTGSGTFFCLKRGYMVVWGLLTSVSWHEVQAEK